MAMGKKRVTVLITAVLALCLIGLRQAEEGRETARAGAAAEGTAGRVALTFDDGPGGESTEALLDGLKERGIKASFFLIGRNIPGKEELVKRMDEEGHLIGSHTYDHVDLTGCSVEEALEEIEGSAAAISKITGKPVRYIRPPFGSWSRSLEEASDMTRVGWTVDSEDWKGGEAARIAERVLKTVRDGDIILFHDVYGSSVEAALMVADALRAQGYSFVTADELILDSAGPSPSRRCSSHSFMVFSQPISVGR